MLLVEELNKIFQRKFSGRVKAVERDGCLVLEGELDHWEDKVRAGALAAKKARKHLREKVPPGKTPFDGIRHQGGVLNDIICTTASFEAMSLPPVQDKALDGQKPDVLIIGGGISGCTIARFLSRYNLDIILVEKEHDLAMHASSRNDGMVHPGADLKKGSFKYYYNHRGNNMYPDLCRELGVPFEYCGQLLCFDNIWMKLLLCFTLPYWKWLGVPARVLGKKELRRLEPGLHKGLCTALSFPKTGIVCPYNLTIACAENAAENGARISLDTAVLAMETDVSNTDSNTAIPASKRIVKVVTNRGTLYPKIVVNAAGVFAEDIAKMAGDRFYSIHPRKGTNSILDKKTIGKVLNTIAARYSGDYSEAHSKGGGIVRTIHGNILVGPDAHETPERENFATEVSSIEKSFKKFRDTSPGLSAADIITYFTGIRAPTYEEDFVVCKGRRTGNLIHAAGIQSPGLTAAPAIAEDVARFAVELLETADGKVSPRAAYNPIRKPIPHLAAMSDAERDALIKANPDYGLILCRCEEVSRGEIIDAINRPVPCDTVDGVKRRVRPGMGRCQGGFCGPLVLRLIAGEKKIPLHEVLKSGYDSAVLIGETKA
ncbi:FAD/NAD(P)-binding oxidoreductase [Spirochaetia bacterium]|nr:FAD/NAD(P)-binding oxidoreductase [Spirochaetia bacterium]